MKPLDRLSALAMAHHADDADLLVWSPPNARMRRTSCKLHMLFVMHRVEHRHDVLKFKPGTVELMVMRDQLEDQLRRGVVLLYSVRKPGNDWMKCPHCRMEQAKKYGHLQT